MKAMPKVALLRVVHSLTHELSDLRAQHQQELQQMQQQHSMAAVPIPMDPNRARAILDHNGGSTWSVNEVDEEGNHSVDESKSEKSDDSTSPRSINSSVRQLSDDGSFVDPSSQVTHSKRVRQLLDGFTVITTGTFGNSKTKHLSISPDLKQLIWKDILGESVKREDITAYKGFVVADSKSNGVVVKYEHKNKSKKMEIPRNNLTAEENRSRVLKWIGFLNSLRETAA
jgi:hypothetical protein